MDNSPPAIIEKRAQIKRENLDEDIKEYAETAMNELLGWYGYGASKEDMRATVNSQSNSNSNSSGPPSPHSTEGCGWCGKTVKDKSGISAGSLSFCSELCFSQSRRANFKKNKTCDWCRHVRHTVSYVDFQDGASQLQFCSDKCLNQYKMHIFCRETRAHLELHPHMPMEDSGTGLITPDLWLRNCKSPDRNSPSPPSSPKSAREILLQTSPLPLITVAHPSKLLAPVENNELNKRKRTPIQRKRKRCPSTITCSNYGKPSDVPQDLRVRHSPTPIFDNHQTFEKVRVPAQETFQQDVRIPPPSPHFFHQNQTNYQPRPVLPSKPAGVLPPVTVLVPYPILIPVPLPIPIPLPLQSFLDAEKSRKSHNTDTSSSNQEKKAEEPLNLENNKVPHQEKTIEEEVTEQNGLVKNGVTRPLRKRKRVVDMKSKVVLKTKKPVST